MKTSMTHGVKSAILLSLSLILLAQALYLPIALTGLLFVALVTLYVHFRKTAVQPFAKLWIGSGVVAALASIYLQYQTFLGVEAGVAVLTTFLFAKALEIKNSRDVIIVFNFALFVSASSFLLSQSVWMALLIFFCLTSSLIGLYRLQIAGFMHSAAEKNSFRHDVLHVVKFIGYALPFFILLFLFFPRLPPLWHIPVPEKKAVTGMSDRMSPGDIAQLSQSSALAFRILGDMSKLPPRSQLYWRAMVLDQYDGQTWTSSPRNQLSMPIAYQAVWAQQPKFAYQYLAADPQQSWITGLEQSVVTDPQYALKYDGSIRPVRAIQSNQPIRLQWVGAGHLNDNVQEHPLNVKRWTEYPAQLDLQAQSFARKLFEQSNRDPERYMRNLIGWYQAQHFAYTLQPGVLGQNRIDEFLFQSKQGFCEHYASSFSLLMRYVGIPARVVVGYQGGELAPDAKSWEVRQLDAHAWTEVKLKQQWIRVDPTAIIAPNRIDTGMQNLMDTDQDIWGEQRSNLNHQQYALLKKIRIWSDYASYQWQSKVVGYNAESQQSWLNKIGIHSTYTMVLVLIISLSLVLAGYFVFIFYRKWQTTSEVERLIERFSKGLQQEWRKHEAETVAVWMLRLAENMEKHEAEIFEKVAELHQKIVYAPQYDVKDMMQLKKMLKTCASVLVENRKHLSK